MSSFRRRWSVNFGPQTFSQLTDLLVQQKPVCFSATLLATDILILIFSGVADYYKNRLWHKPEQKHLVDFLDEAVRRFSAASPADFVNVRMKGVTRPRKVCLISVSNRGRIAELDICSVVFARYALF